VIKSLKDYLEESAETVKAAAVQASVSAMFEAVGFCLAALKDNKAILVCGNGGSAADASHIAGELVGRFLKDRKAMRCISLSDNMAAITAWANDKEFETVFSRQVEAYGEAGGVLIAISTSGNSPNVIKAAITAKEKGMKVIGFTGQDGGELAPYCDALLAAPCRHTPLVQQTHICLYHYLCAAIEEGMA